jgi:hypothetical protein
MALQAVLLKEQFLVIKQQNEIVKHFAQRLCTDQVNVQIQEWARP